MTIMITKVAARAQTSAAAAPGATVSLYTRNKETPANHPLDAE